MAGDWIKMRGALLDHPKVIAIGRALQDQQAFREWLTPGGSGPMNGQIVSDSALRCVTVALLLKVWSIAREHGKFDGNDLVLAHSIIDDLDQMAGVQGFGVAMQAVGWAKHKHGVTLENFIEFNVPMTNAEKQKAYRERVTLSNYRQVTQPLPKSNRDLVTNRLPEKRREDINTKALPPHSNEDSYGSVLPTTTDVYKKLKPEKAEKPKTANGPQTFAQVAASIPQAQTASGLNEPAPNTESSDQRTARLERNKARQLAAIEQRAKADSASLPKADHEGPNGAAASSPPIATTIPPKPPPDAWRTNDAAAYAKALELRIPIQGMTWNSIRAAIGAREGKA